MRLALQCLGIAVVLVRAQLQMLSPDKEASRIDFNDAAILWLLGSTIGGSLIIE
jgi:hypothetical protein